MSHSRTQSHSISFARIALWSVVLALLGNATSTSSAQCGGQWLASHGLAGTDHTVWSVSTCDPDGPGPMGTHIAMTGYFQVAGNVMASRVALYDTTTGEWKALGSGLNGSGFATAIMGNGDLVVGGDFTAAGGTPALSIARWNGSVWSPLGSGLNGTVYSLLALPGGDLVAGGSFTQAGNLTVNGIARWNGSAWSGFGTGVGSGEVAALAVTSNGDIIAGGSFTTIGGIAAKAIARWNGSSWSAIGNGFRSDSANRTGFIGAIRSLPNGDLVAGGSFYYSGNVHINNIARWDGSTWSSMGGGLSSASPEIGQIEVAPNGDMYVGGYFNNNNGSYTNLARWNGTTWSSVGGGVSSSAHCMVFLPNGELYVGGSFDEAGAYKNFNSPGPCVPASNIARWDGTSWAALDSGFTGWIATFLVTPEGDLIAGGRLGLAGDNPGIAVAKRVGSQWVALGPTVYDHYFRPTAYALAVNNDGEIFVGGDELPVPGAKSIAKITPSGWVGLGAGLTGFVNAMVFTPDGDLVAGGDSLRLPSGAQALVVRWNGSVWESMGTRLTGAGVNAAARLTDGSLIIAGRLSVQGGDANGGFARWNGVDWDPLPSPSPGSVVEGACLLALPDGTLIASCAIQPPAGAASGGVYRWNGAGWARVGGVFNGVSELAVLPSGAIVAGGAFVSVDGHPARFLARWSGSTWVAMGSGVTKAEFPALRALATDSNGDLVVGGAFSSADGNAAGSFATWREDTTLPTIMTQPADARACHAGAASFSVGAQSDIALTYRWRHDTHPIDTSVNPSAATATLTIAHAMIADAGLYDCVVTSCGSVTSNSARLRACSSDFNCDGAIDFFDFDDFVVCFEGIACPPGITADFDHDGTVDFFDYDGFISAFESPC